MDDLISRKELLEQLKRYTQDVYECDFDSKSCTMIGMSENPKTVEGLWEAKEIIEDIPVAYNADKVVNQLEKEIELVVNEYPLHGRYIKKSRAIDIVKGGGLSD